MLLLQKRVLLLWHHILNLSHQCLYLVTVLLFFDLETANDRVTVGKLHLVLVHSILSQHHGFLLVLEHLDVLLVLSPYLKRQVTDLLLSLLFVLLRC